MYRPHVNMAFFCRGYEPATNSFGMAVEGVVGPAIRQIGDRKFIRVDLWAVIGLTRTRDSLGPFAVRRFIAGPSGEMLSDESRAVSFGPDQLHWPWIDRLSFDAREGTHLMGVEVDGGLASKALLVVRAEDPKPAPPRA